MKEGGFPSYSLKFAAIKSLLHCCGEGRVEECILGLVSIEDVELLCALYNAGISHELIAKGGVATDDLERLALSLDVDASLSLCWSLSVGSYGCETPLAIEILLG